MPFWSGSLRVAIPAFAHPTEKPPLKRALNDIFLTKSLIDLIKHFNAIKKKNILWLCVVWLSFYGQFMEFNIFFTSYMSFWIHKEKTNIIFKALCPCVLRSAFKVKIHKLLQVQARSGAKTFKVLHIAFFITELFF